MREMKDSGLEWVGEVGVDCSFVPLKYFLESKDAVKVGPFGSQLSGNDFSDDVTDYWVYNQRTVIDNEYETGNAYIQKEKFDSMASFHVHADDILITTRGTIGKISKVPCGHKKGVLHPCIIRFRIDPKKYCYKLLEIIFNSSDFVTRQIIYKSNATTIEVIYSDTLRNIILPYYEYERQEQIADYLEKQCNSFNALIADIQSQIETLEEYKKSLVFRVVSKGIKKANLKSNVSDVWTAIPENWELIDIKYVFEIVKRIAGQEGFDVLSVTQKGLKVKDIESNNGQQAESYAGYQFVYPTDYVMNHMDLLTGWVDCSTMFGVTSPDYRVFRLRDKENNDLIYFKYVMQCCYMSRIFYSLGQGVSNLGRWRLQTSAFNNFMIPVPPLEEQREIADYLDTKISEIDTIIAEKQKQIETIEEYKKSLIFEYVTGKKEVQA